MVVNKSLTQSKTITFNIAGWITAMGEISKTNGTESAIPITGGQVTLTFACMNLKKLATWKRWKGYGPPLFKNFRHKTSDLLSLYFASIKNGTLRFA